jgi:hypothetical protein
MRGLLALHELAVDYSMTGGVDSTEANHAQAFVIATAYTPNSHLLQRAERARGQ